MQATSHVVLETRREYVHKLSLAGDDDAPAEPVWRQAEARTYQASDMAPYTFEPCHADNMKGNPGGAAAAAAAAAEPELAK